MCGNICYNVTEYTEDIQNQMVIQGRPKYTSFEQLTIINKQKEKNVCKIIKGKNISGAGFLLLIPHPDKINLLPTLITCNHVLGKDDIIPGKKINLLFNDKVSKILKIDDSRKTYTSNIKEYDITIIEIKKKMDLI